MIKVLIADDQHLVRGALAALLNLEDDIQVVAECADGDEVAQALDASGAQVALLDVQMPRLDGLRTAQLLRDSHPEVKILIVTTFDRPGYFRQAFEAGASGFLVKDSPPAELVAAIRRVHSGGKVVDPQRAMLSVETRANPLTEREREILALAAGGGTGVADRRRLAPVGRNGAQPPVQRHRQNQYLEPDRGGPHRAGNGLDLAGGEVGDDPDHPYRGGQQHAAQLDDDPQPHGLQCRPG